MNSHSLETLVMLDALGEITVEQQALLREELSKDAALADRHSALCRKVRQMENVMSTLQTRQFSSEASPPIPAHVIARLEAERREALVRRGQSSTNSKVAALPLQATKRGVPPKILYFRPTWLARAAIVALLGMVTGYWFLQHPKQPPVASAALAPRGATGLTQPLIVWDNKLDQKYDVWILPPEGSQKEAPALFTAKNVRSPIAFSELKPSEVAKGQKELQPGKPYRLLVCFATLGRLAGVTVPFETSAEADGRQQVPAEIKADLMKARRLVDSGKPGDALMVLAILPDAERAKPEIKALEDEAKGKLPAPSVTPRG